MNYLVLIFWKRPLVPYRSRKKSTYGNAIFLQQTVKLRHYGKNQHVKTDIFHGDIHQIQRHYSNYLMKQYYIFLLAQPNFPLIVRSYIFHLYSNFYIMNHLNDFLTVNSFSQIIQLNWCIIIQKCELNYLKRMGSMYLCTQTPYQLRKI